MDFLKKLSLEDDKKQAHQTPSAPPPTAVPQKEDNLFHKLGDGLNKLQGKETPAPPPPPPPAPVKEEHLFSKLSDVLQGKKPEPTPPPPPPAPAKEENIFHALGNTIDKLQGKEPPPPPPQPVKEDLFDKIGSAFGKKPPTPPPEPKKTDLLGKLADKITGNDKPPPKPQTLGDKLNHALGGGAKGEAQEGKLDKAIDLFQEHILKEGPQNNESALEQLKDKQIADAIRKTFGIPEKDKGKN